jgi:choline dehydrogenase-like flavoprotein
MASAEPLEGDYDYIIVGAGSAGCVLANRLSADPSKRVLLLEAGGRDNWIWFHIPVGYLFAIGNPRADWMFKTEPEPGLNGRSLNYPRGKVVGGCSAINGMIYMLGQRGDYDHWRQLGLPGWSWDDVRPYFRKHVDHFIAGAEHGQGGEWRVEEMRLTWQILDAFREAAIQYGIPAVEDFNTGDNEGIGYFHVNQRRGRRWSAARGFLKPALGRPNLRLETGCLVERIEFDGARATGVRFRQNGAVHTARCRGEVILSAGAIGSPHILMLSGIGPADDLTRHHDGARQTGRRRQPARSPATAHDLQGQRREDAERDLCLAGAARADGPRLCAAPPRADDDVAVAARRIHQVGPDAEHGQHPVSRAAAVARQVRRSAASVPGLHRERRQHPADQPRRP